MKNNKKTLWNYGLVVSLALGLSSCYFEEYRSTGTQQMTTDVAQHQHQAQTEAKTPVQKTYATKDPAQVSTPGPKRAAAPQIPVIQ